MSSEVASSSMPQPERFLLSVAEAAHRLGVSRRTLEREVCRMKFPPPMKIGAKSVYLVTDVLKYVEKLKADRDKRS